MKYFCKYNMLAGSSLLFFITMGEFECLVFTAPKVATPFDIAEAELYDRCRRPTTYTC